MSDEFDDLFRGVSGLMDDVDVEWLNVVFAREPKLANENGIPVVLKVDFLYDGETKQELFSIGNGWETEDNGARVVREQDGSTRGFNDSTNLQRVLTRLLDLDEDAVKSHYESVGVPPQHAAFWEGLRTHMVQEDYVADFGKKKGEHVKRLMPSALLGWGEATSNGSSATATKPAGPAKKAAKKSTKKAAAPAPVVDELAEVKVKIREIADQCEDVSEFIDRCYAEIDGIDDNAEIQKLVEDDGPESIWQAAVDAAEA